MREFKLVNERNDEYLLNGENGTYFFYPEGLGVSFDNEASRIANGFFKVTNRNEAQESISGTLIFMNHMQNTKTVLHNFEWDGIDKYDDSFVWTTEEDGVDYSFELFKVAEARDAADYLRTNSINYVKFSYKATASSFIEYSKGIGFDFSYWEPDLPENKAFLIYDFDTNDEKSVVKAIIFTEMCIVQEQSVPAGVYVLAVPIVKDSDDKTIVNRYVSSFEMINVSTVESEMSAYSSYKDFVAFVENAKELKLSYKPEDTEYFTDVIIETLDKTELAHEFSLQVEITMKRLSMWYTVSEISAFKSYDTVFYHDVTGLDSSVDHIEIQVEAIDLSFFGAIGIYIKDLETGHMESLCELFKDQMGEHYFPLVYYSSKTGDSEIKIISNQLFASRPIEFDGVQYADLSSDVFISRKGCKSSRVGVHFGEFSLVQSLTMRAIVYYRSI